MSRVSESGMALPHMGMVEEVEMAGLLSKSQGAPRGMSVPRGMPVVEVGTGSPSSNIWSSGESCYGGSTPPGLLSDSSFAETESSEDDDFMAGLAEQMAHSMLDDSDDNTGSSNEVDSVDRAGLWGETGWNPLQQQQLLGLNSPVGETEQLKQPSWSTGCWSSGYSSSSSKVSSPPSTPGAVDDGWDALVGSDGGSLHADEKPIPGGYGSGGHLPEVHWRNAGFSEPRNGALPVLTKPYAAVVNSRRGWNQKEEDKRAPTQCRTSKQPPVGVWNRQNRCQQPQPQQQQQQQPCVPGPRPGYRCGVVQRPIQPPAWQPIPPTNGSVMRAVFLGGASDRSSCGTGVFLPRSSNDYSKRKTSCSSVLLPSRIVQVLNLNVDDMRCHPPVQSGTSYPENGASVPAGSVETVGGSFSCPPDEVWSSNSQWKTYTFCSQLHQPHHSESTLPSEWRY